MALAVGIGALLTWRAASQSITYDEAFTWLEFVSRPPGEFLINFTANNQVLFSLFAWVTTRTFGANELTLRLPSVVAGMAYAAVAVHLSRRICPGRGLATATIVALVLNPFVLDFFVAARGYGLATTCLLGALLLSIRPSVHTAPTLAATGALLGLSVTANLAYSFPAAGVSAATAILASLRSRTPARTLVRASATLGLALALTALPVLIMPVQHRPPRDAFSYGARTFREASRSLVAASLQYDVQNRWSAPDWFVDALSATILPLLVAACVISGWAAITWRARHPESRLRASAVPAFVIGTTMAVTVAALWITNRTANLPLPLERTGLYWLALIPAGMAASARALHQTPGWLARGSRLALGAALALLCVVYAAQFSTTHFRTWQFDAGSREIFTAIAEWPCPTTHRRIVSGTPFRFAPALEFYRVLRQAEHVHPLDILEERYAPGEPDFYVFSTPQEVQARPPRTVVILRHTLSGATLLASDTVAACAPVTERR